MIKSAYQHLLRLRLADCARRIARLRLTQQFATGGQKVACAAELNDLAMRYREIEQRLAAVAGERASRSLGAKLELRRISNAMRDSLEDLITAVEIEFDQSDARRPR